MLSNSKALCGLPSEQIRGRNGLEAGTDRKKEWTGTTTLTTLRGRFRKGIDRESQIERGPGGSRRRGR
jgi:hypothetical protein